MKPSRKLFYALVLIFLAGIVLTCMTENTSVWSRKEEQMLVIGDLEEFYKDTMQHNVDFRDVCVFNIHSLANSYDAIGKLMQGIVGKELLESWKTLASYLQHAIEGYDMKNVMTMREEEVEDC